MFVGRDSTLPWELSLGIQRKRYIPHIVPGTGRHADIREHRVILVKNLCGKSL